MIEEVHVIAPSTGKVHLKRVFATLCGKPVHGNWKETDKPVNCRQCKFRMDKKKRRDVFKDE